MAEGSATRSLCGHRTICLPVSEVAYTQAVNDPAAFRRLLDEHFRTTPELFPPDFARGYELKDGRMSVKQGLPVRRILLKDGTAYSVRPSFLMPYMTARVADVEGPLFLRKFGVPYWALAHVFGADPMYWYRQSVGWAGSASWAPPYARRTSLYTFWPTSTINRSTDRRCTSPRPSATGVAWRRNPPRPPGPTT